MAAVESRGAHPLAARLLRHPWWVLGAWAVFFVVLLPTALTYTDSISYSGSSAALSGSESARAAAILQEGSQGRSTLFVVVSLAGVPDGSVANATLSFQDAVSTAHIPYLNGTASAYSAYAGYLDAAFASEVPAVQAAARDTTNLTQSIYSVPAAFLRNWTAAGATQTSINATWNASGAAPVGYDAALRSWLWANFTTQEPPVVFVQSGIEVVAPSYFPVSPLLNFTLSKTNVTSYTTATPALVAAWLSEVGPSPIPVSWVVAALAGGDFGRTYVIGTGLTGAPGFLTAPYLSPDGAVELVSVSFNVSESFRTSAGVYPAQAATGTLRTLAAQHLGAAGIVTGPGAVAYDSQQLESGAGVLFALTFVLLAVAVALTLRSWIAPILALVIVTLSQVLGYLAIVLTGTFVGKVDFTVTYTLTAVTLGVATDYLLFVFYRYREELTRGATPETALETATRASGFAVLVSSLTVAVGLGTLSFLNGLTTWGPVLFVTVAAIGLLELSALPALLRLVGPRLFVRRWMKPARPPETSVFYRAARASTARPGRVLLVAAVVAVPAVLGFVLVPTTYDFTGNLPASFPSSRGQAVLEQSFGANLLFPAYVLVEAPGGGSFLAANGSLTPTAGTLLPTVATDLVARTGVASVNGPFVEGRNLTGPAGAQAFLLEGGRYAVYVVATSYDPYSPSAIHLVESLRANSSYLVGGLTSSVIDQQQLDSVQFPVLELLLTLFLGLILGLSFRSVAVPLASLSGVFLSVTATTGLLYLVATYVLHQPLVYLIPLILFVILFSLGNDYTVFLFARVREEQSRTARVEGIHRGIAGSGVVVSALGLILAASLGSLALQPLAFLEQIGIAFVASLLLDTFLVRPFYFPAVLRLRERFLARRAGRPEVVEPPSEDSAPADGGR